MYVCMTKGSWMSIEDQLCKSSCLVSFWATDCHGDLTYPGSPGPVFIAVAKVCPGSLSIITRFFLLLIPYVSGVSIPGSRIRSHAPGKTFSFPRNKRVLLTKSIHMRGFLGDWMMGVLGNGYKYMYIYIHDMNW